MRDRLSLISLQNELPSPCFLFIYYLYWKLVVDIASPSIIIQSWPIPSCQAHCEFDQWIWLLCADLGGDKNQTILLPHKYQNLNICAELISDHKRRWLRMPHIFGSACFFSRSHQLKSKPWDSMFIVYIPMSSRAWLDIWKLSKFNKHCNPN